MRVLTLLPCVLLLSGCLAPGERDPTRYPWDSRNAPLARHPPLVAQGAIPPLASPPAPAQPGQGQYCVIALAPPNPSGITVGGKAPGIVTCASPAPAIAPSSTWHEPKP